MELFTSRCADGIPDIPLVKANRYWLRNASLYAGHIYQSGGNLDCTFGGERPGYVGHVLLVGSVDMNAVIVDPFNTLIEDIIVPLIVPLLSAENKFDGRIKEFECLGPLVGFLCVVFFGIGFDLPFAVDFVSEGPVFYVVGLRMTVFAPLIGPVSVLCAVAVFEPSKR